MMYVLVTLAVVLLDQCSKWYAWLCAPRYIISATGISWCWVLNYGVSWSLCAPRTPMGTIALFTILCIMACSVVYFIRYTALTNGCRYAAHILLGGALSNIVDRLIYGGVGDWIVLQWRGCIWPVFNIADIAIVCSVLYLVMYYETKA